MIRPFASLRLLPNLSATNFFLSLMSTDKAILWVFGVFEVDNKT